MIRFWSAILGAVLSFCAWGPMADDDLAYAYIEKYSPVAISEMMAHDIPASIKLGQALIESKYGTSVLARASQNHFGLKCKDYWSGKRYYHIDDDLDNEGHLRESCFRSYDCVAASYQDHSFFLKRSPVYKSLFMLDRKDYKSWAAGLKKCGYATDPYYAQKLIRIIERYQLTRFDHIDPSHDAQVASQTKWKTNHMPPEPFLIPVNYVRGAFKKK